VQIERFQKLPQERIFLWNRKLRSKGAPNVTKQLPPKNGNSGKEGVTSIAFLEKELFPTKKRKYTIPGNKY